MKPYLILLIAVFSAVVFTPVFGENLGSIAVNLSYTNGDIADYGPVSLKIYQDFESSPFKQIDHLSGNPFNVIGLPIGHKYKIEAFANSMHSGIAYVDLQQPHQDTKINLPLPGGMRINAYYNDKTTPISNATVFIRSQDNKTWSYSPINNLGQSLRFWIAPTISSDDHYIADIKIGNHLVYTQSPIYLQAGIPQEIKIVTSWPALINSLVTVKMNVETKDKFVVDMLDDKGNKISESVMTARGESYFSNMIVGEYTFVAINQTDGQVWGSKNATIDGSILNFEITKTLRITNQTTQEQATSTPSAIVPPHISCNCVSFRLDNVQDYWLDNVQMAILDTFVQKQTGLTVGIIGNAFGSDNSLVDYTKLHKDNLDLAINGWNFEDFTTLDKNDQEKILGEAKSKILSVFGITPSVFIPPYGKYDNNTLDSMSETNINVLSSSYDIGYQPNQTHILAAKISGDYFAKQDMTSGEFLSKIKYAVNNDGFATITLNFPDFAQNNGTQAVNVPDSMKVQKLADVIDALQNNGIRIVSLSQMSQEISTENIPSWIKNNAKWWSDGTISDDDFIKGIQYLVQNKIIKVPQTQEEAGLTHTIPSWVKNNAKWWSDGTISDDDFIKGIQYLVQNGIIKT